MPLHPKSIPCSSLNPQPGQLPQLTHLRVHAGKADGMLSGKDGESIPG